MKKLYFMRHAKSDWLGDVDDKDRIINYIGINEAKKIAAEIIKKEIKFDKIICSPAKRAYQTAEIIKNKIGFSDEIIIEESFYFDYQKEILKVIKNIDNQAQSVLLVGHNPTWSQMVSQLKKSPGKIYLDNANFVCLSADFNDWKEANYEKFDFEYIISPKNL